MELGALLLEGIPNESPLSESAASAPASAIVELITALHRVDVAAARRRIESLAARVEFIFDHWTARCRGSEVLQVVPLALLERGRQLARELATDDRQGALLHGDLHPGNVLDGGPRGLVAIDPRPCAGDPAFDVVDWVFWNTNADHWQTRSHDLARRLEIAPGRVLS